MSGITIHRGDTGLFRSALLLAGFWQQSEGLIFNDRSHAEPTRRLKLWFADSVFNAPLEQQALEGLLREAFGDRITEMEFIPGGWNQDWKSLTIRLRD